MNGQRAIVFCNGLRERMIKESGDLPLLSKIFDCFIDTSAFSKPWEYKQSYGDRIKPEHSVTLQTPEEAEAFFSKRKFSYVLFVGLEWSSDRERLVNAVNWNSHNWGILFIRGDMRDLFRGRKYDDRLAYRWKKLLKRRRNKKNLPAANHYFSNEQSAADFPEVQDATELVTINHIDRHFMDQAEAIDEDVGLVFLDQALTYTYDDADENIFTERFFDPDRSARHFKHVNGYLKALSKANKLPVTVCLHPNWPEHRETLYSKEFRVTREQTVSYLKSARLAVTHSSMATGFCHMLHVPTILLDLPSDILPKYVRREIRRKSRNEGLPIQKWPGSGLLTKTVAPANNQRVRSFLMPDSKSHSIGDILYKNIIESPRYNTFKTGVK